DLLALDEAGIAGSNDVHLAQHLTRGDLDMLVVDFHALQEVHVLNFIDDVFCQVLDALETQDVVRVERTFRYHFAFLDMLALEYSERTPFRNQHLVVIRAICQRLAVGRSNDQATLAFGFFTEADGTGDLGENRRLFRLARLEQIGHARQTTGDVAGLRRLLWDPCDNVAHSHHRAVFQADDRVGRQEVVRRYIGASEQQLNALVINQRNRRTHIFTGHRALARIHY